MATGDKLVNLNDLKTVHDYTQGQVSDLKSAVTDIDTATIKKKQTTIEPTNPRTGCAVQYNGTTGVYAFYDTSAFAYWKSYVYDVEPGQSYIAYGSKYPSTPTVVYMDASGNYIGNEGYDINYTEWVAVDNNITVRIPNNCAKMVVQKSGSLTTPVAKLIEYENNLLDDVDALQSDFANISTLLVPDGIEPIEITLDDGYYIGSTHIIAEIGNTSYKVAKNIPVTPGDNIVITARVGYKTNMFYCFYDSNGGYVDGVVSESAITERFDVIVPDGASTLAVSGYNGTASVELVESYKIKGKWVGKKWVVIGDSLTQINSTSTKRYHEYVADVTGISVANFGIGGTGYANPNGTAGNFVDRMASVPTDADVYTIFGSFNDYTYNDLPIGNATDSGTSTLCGYINAAFDALFARVPLANLGVIAPCPWVSINQVTSSGTFGKDYSAALKACCERRSIPFLDLYAESGLRPWDADFRDLVYTDDPASGVHPNAIGHAILATKIEAFLDGLLMH